MGYRSRGGGAIAWPGSTNCPHHRPAVRAVAAQRAAVAALLGSHSSPIAGDWPWTQLASFRALLLFLMWW